MMIIRYLKGYFHRSILKRVCNSWLIITLVLGCVSPVGAIEFDYKKREIDNSISIEQDYLEGKDFSDQSTTLRLWSDIDVSWEIKKHDIDTKIADMKLVLYPLLEYNLTDKKDKLNLRKGYGAILFKETYISIGKQPILWGVAGGINPTNYLMRLNLFDKQRTPELALEGIESLLIEFPIKDITVETVFARSDEGAKSIKNATRFKTFVWDTDLSLSFYRDTDKNNTTIGGDFVKDIHGWFNLYGELAYKDIQDDYQFVAGITKFIPYLPKSSLSLEYAKDNTKEKKDEYFTLQVLISPGEELSLVSLTSYYLEKDVILSMTRIGYYIGKAELTVTFTFRLKDEVDDFPFKYIISPKIIYYF